jgi:protease I
VIWYFIYFPRYHTATGLVQKMYNQDKTIGLIGHVGLVAISAGIVREHKAAGSSGIKDDLINAGPTWVDIPALCDRNIVWGRSAEDIPVFVVN